MMHNDDEFFPSVNPTLAPSSYATRRQVAGDPLPLMSWSSHSFPTDLIDEIATFHQIQNDDNDAVVSDENPPMDRRNEQSSREENGLLLQGERDTYVALINDGGRDEERGNVEDIESGQSVADRRIASAHENSVESLVVARTLLQQPENQVVSLRMSYSGPSEVEKKITKEGSYILQFLQARIATFKNNLVLITSVIADKKNDVVTKKGLIEAEVIKAEIIQEEGHEEEASSCSTDTAVAEFVRARFYTFKSNVAILTGLSTYAMIQRLRYQEEKQTD